MGLIHISGQVKFDMFLSVSLERQNIHFPYFEKGSSVQNIFYMCCLAFRPLVYCT